MTHVYERAILALMVTSVVGRRLVSDTEEEIRVMEELECLRLRPEDMEASIRFEFKWSMELCIIKE